MPNQNLSHQELMEFFEALGNSSTYVNDHYRWNTNEIKGALRKGINLTVMLIDSPFVAEQGNNATNVNDVYNCALTFLGKQDVNTGKMDSYVEQDIVLNHTLEVAKKFRAKISSIAEEDQIAGEKNWLYGRLVKGSFKFIKAGPVFSDMLYGYRLQFQLRLRPDLEVISSDWK